jgi:hypothetical protein
MNSLKSWIDVPSNRTCLGFLVSAAGTFTTALLANQSYKVAALLSASSLFAAVYKFLQPDNTAAIAARVINSSSTEHGDSLIAAVSSNSPPVAK